MKKYCPCGGSWEGDGACPRCFMVLKARDEDQKLSIQVFKTTFEKILKTAAATPTQTQQPPGLGPLWAIIWRIAQLGIERTKFKADREILYRELRDVESWLEGAEGGWTICPGVVSERIKKVFESIDQAPETAQVQEEGGDNGRRN